MGNIHGKVPRDVDRLTDRERFILLRSIDTVVICVRDYFSRHFLAQTHGFIQQLIESDKRVLFRTTTSGDKRDEQLSQNNGYAYNLDAVVGTTSEDRTVAFGVEDLAPYCLEPLVGLGDHRQRLLLISEHLDDIRYGNKIQSRTLLLLSQGTRLNDLIAATDIDDIPHYLIETDDFS